LARDLGWDLVAAASSSLSPSLAAGLPFVARFAAAGFFPFAGVPPLALAPLVLAADLAGGNVAFAAAVPSVAEDVFLAGLVGAGFSFSFSFSFSFAFFFFAFLAFFFSSFAFPFSFSFSSSLAISMSLNLFKRAFNGFTIL